MNIVDWFDVKNIEHLSAYKILQDTGMWPESSDFIPEDIEFLMDWRRGVSNKIASAFIDEKIGRLIKDKKDTLAKQERFFVLKKGDRLKLYHDGNSEVVKIQDLSKDEITLDPIDKPGMPALYRLEKI